MEGGSADMVEVVVSAPPMGCTITLSDSGKLCEVEGVEEGSRAAGAGVEVGDVLLSANGQPPPIDLESEAALVRFFRGLRYPLRLAFARRCCDRDVKFRAAAHVASAEDAASFVEEAAEAAAPAPAHEAPPRREALASPPKASEAPRGGEPARARPAPFAVVFDASNGRSDAAAALKLASTYDAARGARAPLLAFGDEEAADPILAATRATLGTTSRISSSSSTREGRPKRPKRRKDRRRGDDGAAADRAPDAGVAQRLWASRWHVATTVAGFGLGYAYFRLRYVEDYERGY